jgi:alpha-D-xyloside xylohydrolase
MKPAKLAVPGWFLFALLLLPALGPRADAQWNPLNPVTDVEPQGDGVRFAMKTGALQLEVTSDAMVHVLYSPTGSFPQRQDYVVIRNPGPSVRWTEQSTEDTVTLATSRLRVVVTRKDGSITFLDAAGKKLFEDFGRTMTPVEVNGEKTYHAEMFSNLWGSYEAFYGLGQHQAGALNYRGQSVDISEDNTNISIPLFLSTNGYGIFWNNTSHSRFNNRFLSALYLSSEVADVIDYYFIYGPEFDQVIAGYRALTGQVPLFGKWAYGFWRLPTSTASCIFRSMTLCRTGSGGTSWASRPSTSRAIPIPKRCSTICTRIIFTP